MKILNWICLSLALTACGKMKTGESLSSSITTPPAPTDIIPYSFPAAIDPTTWAGVTGLNSSTLTSNIQGRWLTPCLSGYAQTVTFVGSQMREVIYGYGLELYKRRFNLIRGHLHRFGDGN